MSKYPAKLYAMAINYPKSVLAAAAGLTLIFGFQLSHLRWETDARVYLPKGHPAIIYDEKVDDVFGVKDNIIIAIVNDEQGIYNPESLDRVRRITDKVKALEGVIATRGVDIASLATATVFFGTDKEIGSKPLMLEGAQSTEQIARIKTLIEQNADLFVGNIVSADGKAAIIRAKIKEGANNRWWTYFQIKRIIAEETGDWSALSSGWGGDWKDTNVDAQGADKKVADEKPVENAGKEDWQKWQTPEGAQADKAVAPVATIAPGGDWKKWQAASTPKSTIKDKFYLAGRPVIEVSSGMYALQDMVIMIPAVLLVMALVLLLIFRSFRGMLLPLLVMAMAITWTLGLMAALDIPMYTISTMLPVILVAVGIGDAVHVISHYNDLVLEDPHRKGADIMRDVMAGLGSPVIITSVTTAIGFLSNFFADMPPFRTFGIFAAVGVMLAWLVSVTVLPAFLSLLKPHIAGYLAKRRNLRVHANSGLLTRALVAWGGFITRRRHLVAAITVIVVVIFSVGTVKLYVDSSWLSDFKKDSDVAVSTDVLNTRFSGSIFLNVVIETERKDGLKDPQLLHKMDALQHYVATLPEVGDSLSVVNYLKNMNKNLHAGDAKYDVIPETQQQIAEYLFLFSVSGRPEQLDQVVDYDYKTGLVSIVIKTDHTLELKHIIESVESYVAREFAGVKAKVNLSGSANNSFIWARLLIDSQLSSIAISKIGIFLVAALLFRALLAGAFVVVPVSLSTLMVAGGAGWLGVPLDVSTALAAGIAIGVGVDYAVHYIHRYYLEYEKHQDHEKATSQTLRSAGKNIVLNAFVVVAGFAVLLASQFPPHIKLGYLVVVYMIVSFISALVILPLMYEFFKPKLRHSHGT
ncbi:MAG: MMPL family transporter [Gammaproteobacteria bacterium]|nr:MMPL family transporter [Gammaproteobacteria bacterium]